MPSSTLRKPPHTSRFHSPSLSGRSPAPSDKSPAPPNKSRKKALYRLEHASSILGILENLAAKSTLPGLGLVVATAKSIVNLARDAERNVDGAITLAERICGILQVLQSNEMCLTDETEDKLEQFNSTLTEVRQALAQITERSHLKATYHSFEDTQTLKGLNEKVDRACERFQLDSLLSLRRDNLKQTETNVAILKELQKLESKLQPSSSSGTSNSSSSVPPRPVPPKQRPKRPHPKASIKPPQSTSTSTDSQPKVVSGATLPSTHTSRVPPQMSRYTRPKSKAVSSGEFHRELVEDKDQATVITIVTKTTTTREFETNTRTTKESVKRQPISVLSLR